jgi:hypothetical protein
VTVEALLTALWARGVQLEAVGDRLRFRPREAVPAALRGALAHYKAEVLAQLRAASSTPELPLDLPPRAAAPRHYRAPANGRDLWPRDLPGLGTRRIDAYTHCASCGGPTWVYYGGRPQCRSCAERAAAFGLREPDA